MYHLNSIKILHIGLVRSKDKNHIVISNIKLIFQNANYFSIY